MSNTGAQALGTETGPPPEAGPNAPRAEKPPRWKSRNWLRRQGVIALVALGPVLALTTAFVMGDGAPAGGAGLLRTVLLIDLCYLIALVALIGSRVSSLVRARRRRSAGSQLHLRLAGVFALIALVPTVIVATFAALSVNFGIESWFSNQVGSVVRNSLSVAEAYEREHRENIGIDILRMANDLNRAADNGMSPQQLNDFVRQQAALRELPEAFVFNSKREILARGEFSYLFSFEPPTADQIARAREGEVVIMEDEVNNEIRALVYLTNYFDAFLYVSREVQGDVLRLLDDNRATVQLYEQLEQDRNSLLFDFALIYLGFALLVIVAAILLGLWFAERLAQPVGQLAAAAERIGAGDLDARVPEDRNSDEIGMLSVAFNRMAGQVKGQRDALISAHDETERRRHFIEAMLSGVTAGVIGVDGEGRIDLANEAAAELLGLEVGQLVGRRLKELVPSFAPLVVEAAKAPGGVARGEVRQVVAGQPREYLARFAPKSTENPGEGHVLTFDDITALASAQRMAAWGDVARRIAHEIKNPLTPIQLSADRLRRKFVGRLAEDGPAFEQIIDVITRQTADIRRMVDEFSRFARMPEPKLAEENLAQLVREAVLLQSESRNDIGYTTDLPKKPVPLVCDRGLMSQCLTNLLQNAADAIEARAEAGEAPLGRIHVSLASGPRNHRITVADNGIGLPKAERARLTDPYVTTRKKGTGLGLAIVSKIAEQHQGEVRLGDGPDGDDLDGAWVTLRLPRAKGRQATESAAENAA